MTAVLVALCLFLIVLSGVLMCRRLDHLPPRKDS